MTGSGPDSNTAPVNECRAFLGDLAQVGPVFNAGSKAGREDFSHVLNGICYYDFQFIFYSPKIFEVVDFAMEFEPLGGGKNHLPSYLAPRMVPYKGFSRFWLNLCLVSTDLEDANQTHPWSQTPGYILRLAGLYFLQY